MLTKCPDERGRRAVLPKSMTRAFKRAAIEIGFILFLFYANLLMGEFTVSGGRGKTFRVALVDIFTATNFLIAIVAALVGYMVFEYLRKQV